MAKKKSIKAKMVPTFEVRLVGPGLAPEKIPIRAVSDVLSAVQDLASGRDPFQQQQVPPEKGVGLIEVRRGSAIYSCLSRAPVEALDNLTQVGVMLSTPEDEPLNGNGLVTAFRPIKKLSEVANSIGCQIEVTTKERTREPLLTIGKDDFKRISSRLFVRGETTVVGRLERAGGATEMRCALRVPGRRPLLYCDVKNRDLVRRLGKHLYEEIAATGAACWLHQSWTLVEFTINDFTQPRAGDPTEAIERLRRAGLNAWDQIDDPQAYIQELRQ